MRRSMSAGRWHVNRDGLALRRTEPLITLPRMGSAVNGSVHRGVPEGDAVEGSPVEPAWRDHFLRVLSRSPRFGCPRRFLQKDSAAALGQAIPKAAPRIGAGVGG